MRSAQTLVAVTLVTAGAIGVSHLFGLGSAVMVALVVAGVLSAALADPRAAWFVFFSAVSATGMSIHVGGGTVRPELAALPFLLIAMRPRAEAAAQRRMPLHGAAAVGLAALLLIGLYSSSTAALEPAKSLWILLQLSNSVACFLLIARNRIDLRVVLRVGTAVMTIASFIGVLAFAGQHLGGLHALNFALAADGRVQALSIEPNIFGCQATGWLAIMYARRTNLSRASLWAASVILLADLLAGTRAAWVALALITVIMVLRTFRRPGVLVMSLAATATLVFVTITVISTLGANGTITPQGNPTLWRVGHPLDTSSGSGAYRVEVYRLAVDDIRASGRWLFGSGMNSYSQLHPVDPTGATKGYLSSIWYELVYDVGFVGLAAFLAFLVAYFLSLRRRADALPIFIAVLLCASTTNTVWIAFMWVYFALVAQLSESQQSADGAEVRSTAIRPISMAAPL